MNKKIKTLHKLNDEEKKIIAERYISRSVNKYSKVTDVIKVSEASREQGVVKVFSISEADITVMSSDFIYDGTEKQPEIVVKHNNKILTSKDYGVTYTSNINAGTAKVTVTGRGTYEGTVSKNFKINPKLISDAKLIITPDSFSYDGNEKTPSVTVKDGNITLSENDFGVAYTSNRNAGTGTVIVTGKGNYIGTVKGNFRIEPISIERAKLTISQTVFKYDGTKNTPSVTVTDGNNVLPSNIYNVSYTSNINIGTATVTVTGKGNYTGILTKEFKIIPQKSKLNPVWIAAAVILILAAGSGIILANGHSNDNNTQTEHSAISIESQKSDINTVSSKTVSEKSDILVSSENPVKNSSSSSSSIASTETSKENTENKNDITDNDTQNNNETHQPSVEISEPSVITETSVNTPSQPSPNDTPIQESSEEQTRSAPFIQIHTGDTSVQETSPESEPSASFDTSAQTNPLISITSPDGLDYTFNTNNNTLTITGEGTITGSFSDFENHTVQKIKTVIIGSKVTGIGYGTFDSCESLETVKMRDNLVSIEGSAFLGCTALKEIHLSNSLKELGDAVFNGCISLQEITVPEQVTVIYTETFKNCTALKAIHMSKNIQQIDDDVFTGCNKDILTIYAPKGSYAQTYADKNNIKFIEEGIAVEDNSATDSSVT